MYFNAFASGTGPLDLSGSEEFASLAQSANDFGMTVRLPVRYCSRNAVVNGVRLHFLEWGDPSAPPVLLLHGGNMTAHSWDLVSLNLAARHHVIALDQRGHGDSEWPRDGDAAIPTLAEDIRHFIETLELERPSIVAHSMGGLAALMLLSRHDVVGRCVLVDISPEASGEGREGIREFVRAAREFDSVEEYVERVSAYEPNRSRELILRTMRYNLMQRADGKLVSKHFPRTARPDGDARPMRGVTLSDVTSIRCPVLLLRGEQSTVLTPEAAGRLVAALPECTLVTVPDCAHNIHTQNPRGFLSAALPFLEA